MRLVILAVGRMRPGPEAALTARYADRFAGAGRGIGLSGIDIKEVIEGKARSAAERRRDEAARLTSLLPPAAPIAVLDETGKSTGSRGLAEVLARWRDDGARDAAFVIGGPDGLDENLRRDAELAIAFGKATWPHMLVRAMLSEQLYRAATILSGHPYHRD